MTLDRPVLFAIVAALSIGCAVLLARRSHAEGSRARGRAALAVRAAVLALLALALAGPSWRREREEVATVFVVDASDSSRDRAPAAAAWVGEAIATARADDLAGIVEFGRDALVEQELRSERLPIALASAPDPSASRLSDAVALARALLPPGGRRRVVALTDGAVDAGSADALRLLREAGVDVALVPLEGPAGPETLVDDVVAPDRVAEGEPFEVRVVLRASAEAEGVLTISRDGVPIAREDVRVGPSGSAVLRLLERHDAGGTHRYRAHFDAEPDGFAQNDAAEALVRVEGRPSILLVDRDPSRLGAALALFEAAGLRVRAVGPEGLPRDLAEAAAHDGIVLSDLEALEAGVRQMEALRAHVRDLGGGLLMAGGPGSFGPGGWYGTPVEEALPVDMDVRNEKYYPSLALLTIIDKSGSMSGSSGASKLDLAKEAAAMAIELLHPRDRAGVIAFDSAAKWVVEMGDASEKAAMARRVGTIVPGGGTDLYPALLMGRDAIVAERTVLKHVIVLSDGQSPPRDYQGLVASLREARVTVSAVAVGTDADLVTMRAIADAGGGRYYFTDDATTIPRIFTKEAFTSARSVVVEERFVPRPAMPHPVLRGAGALPALAGYVAATAKPAADVALVTHRDDPLLALHRTGVGRAAALTTDLGTRWAGSWLASEEGRTLLAQLLRWVASRSESSGLRASLEPRDGGVAIVVEGRDASGAWLNFADLRARVVGPDMAAREVALAQVAPGRYEASVDAGSGPSHGAWFAGVVQHAGGRDVRGTVAAHVTPYSDEYRAPRGGGGVEGLALASGARVVTDPAEAFVRTGEPAASLRPAWREALALAALLFLLDAGIRRVMLPEGWTARLAAWASRLRRTPPARAPLPELARLREVKVGALDAVARAEPAPRPPPVEPPHPGEQPAGERPPVEPAPDAPAEPPVPPGAAGDAFADRLLAAKRRARRD